MVVIKIDSIGDEQFVRGMNRYVAQMRDFREVFREIQQDFYKINEKNFAEKGSPISFTVASNPRYVAWKKKRVGHNRPMILFDTLRKSLTGQTANTEIKINKKDAVFGTNVPYANYHYYVRNSKAVQLTREDKDRWAKMIHRWAYKKWKQMAVAPSFRGTI